MKKKILIYSSTSVLIFAAIAIMVNIISSYVYLRTDFTSGGIYSLSGSSKKILRSLPDRIIIKAYFTKDLPQEYGVNRKYVEDVLSEYRTYSGGKVSYSFIDPHMKMEALREVEISKIPPVQFTQIRRDKYEVKEGYMGLLFIYGDRKEVIPFVRSVDGLEYDITSKIKKLLYPELKKIAISAGNREMTDFSDIKEQVSERYKTEIVDLSISTFVPEGISSLLVIGPRQKFSEKSLLAVDQLIMKDMPVALLLDNYIVNNQWFFATAFDNGFKDFLDFYGVRIMPGFVVDPQCNRISLRQNKGYYAIENVFAYPLFPLVTDFERSNAITRSLESTGFIFLSPVEIKKKYGFDYDVVMRSSAKSWFLENPRYLNPYMPVEPPPSIKKGPINLAVIIAPATSKTAPVYKSYFADRKEKRFRNILRESKKTGRIFVIGNSSFVTREPAFFMNLLDWLSQDEDLIAIRSKGASYRPLKPVTETTRGFVKYTSIFFLPALIAAYGLFRWNKRNNMKKEFKNLYA